MGTIKVVKDAIAEGLKGYVHEVKTEPINGKCLVHGKQKWVFSPTAKAWVCLGCAGRDYWLKVKERF